jgi:hypothetical protein
LTRGETYEEFVQKFSKSAPKTTDECYTPRDVYDAVLGYVADTYGVDPQSVIRPFYPGGDYEHEDYAGGVVDNPPFSSISKIIAFYTERKIPYFLFASGLHVLNTIKRIGYDAAVIVPGVSITYENGARVNTCFVTNLEEACLRSDGALRDALRACPSQTKPRCVRKPRPEGLVTSCDLSSLARNGDFCYKVTSGPKPGEAFYGGAAYVESFQL